MLKNIPPVLSPDLLKIMREMGHGDVIVLADANYPAASGARRLVRLDGAGVTELLDAMLRFFPLDRYVESPVSLMQPEPEDSTPEIWREFEAVIRKRDEEKAFNGFRLIERMAFYEYAKEAFAIVQTGTTAHYANIALKKGVV
jgi:L-fucose mutarotase